MEMKWIKKIFKSTPKSQPEPVKEIIDSLFETKILRARISKPSNQHFNIDPNYVLTQNKNQLALELLEQIVNQDLIEFTQTQDFGQNIIEAEILISIKK
jgi:hypothetical protein